VIIEDRFREDSEAWVAALRGPSAIRHEATARLYALLLRGVHFELSRSNVATEDLDALETQIADAALGAVVASLDDFHGQSRFTTWASKFALREAAVTLRRRTWRGREVSFEIQDRLPRAVEETLRRGRWDSLSPRQRNVFTALVLNDVPIDVLAEHLGSTRGELYRTLHDARHALRAGLLEVVEPPSSSASEVEVRRRGPDARRR